MRAVVVGLGWGRVHVAALREAGVEVVALCAREGHLAAAAAEELAVPSGFGGLDPVAGLRADLISVAVPADQHAGVIALLPPSVPIICEKPAVGLAAPVRLPRGRAAPVWVNYAFAFLDVASVASAELAALGGVGAVHVDSRYDLGDDPRTGVEMFFELTVHPWSWLVTLLGAAAEPATALPASPGGNGSAVAIDVAFGGISGRLSCGRSPGLSGISHKVVIDAAAGRLRVLGRYRIGQPWSFRVDVDQGAGWQQVGAEHPHAGQDPWYRANAAAIAAAVAVVRGAPADARLFDWDRALDLDRLAQRRLRDGGWRW